MKSTFLLILLRVDQLWSSLMDLCGLDLWVVVLALLSPLKGQEDNYHDSKAVGKRVTSLTCELEGIPLGLELSVRYFRSCKQRKLRESVYIFCDCTIIRLLISL